METKITKDWILDEITETVQKNISKEDLIKQLHINMFQYGMTCFAEAYVNMNNTTEKALLTLDKKIRELGATLRVIIDPKIKAT